MEEKNKMSKKISKKMLLYFSFLTISLVVITGLSVFLLIDTSSRINEIRARILASPNKVRTEERIILLSQLYESLLTDIRQVSGDLGWEAQSKSEQILNEIARENNLAGQFNRRLAQFEARIRFRRDRHNHQLANRYDFCRQVAANVTAFIATTPAIFQQVEEYQNNATITKFHTHMAELLRPAGSIMLTVPNFQLNATTRPVSIYPNNNEYLAVDDKRNTYTYYPAPQISDFSRIRITPAANRHDGGVFLSENATENYYIRVESHLEAQTPLINYEVNHLPVIPWIFGSTRD